MASDKLHGVGTVHDRALQLSFPLISSVSRAVNYTSVKSQRSPRPHLHPHKKTLGWLSTEENFCEFIQHYVPKLYAHKTCSANLP